MYPKLDAVTPDVFIHELYEGAVTAHTCELWGELLYEGEPAVTEYGICYRLKGATSYTYRRAAGKDNYGRYKFLLVELMPNTDYEAWAYAIQNGKIIHGGLVEPFTTKQGRGSITFWTADPGLLPISITMNGETRTLNSYWNSFPGCGANGAVTFANLPYGTYTFSYKAEGYTAWKTSSGTLDTECAWVKIIIIN
jgi:hypothetical protein